jgi:RNA polymerase sigma-70 factor, ECF subfamily
MSRLAAEQTFSDATDPRLVSFIVDREEDALREVVSRYGQAVVGLARRVLHDEALAQDIAQEVFVDLWHRCDRFDLKRGSLRSLLMTQAHGKSVDLIRSRNARTMREERTALERPDTNQDVDADLMQLATAVHVREALQQIPREESVAIELAYFGAHTYKEVARLLNLPEGTVKTRIRMGLRHLSELLSESERF